MLQAQFEAATSDTLGGVGAGVDAIGDDLGADLAGDLADEPLGGEIGGEPAADTEAPEDTAGGEDSVLLATPVSPRKARHNYYSCRWKDNHRAIQRMVPA